MIYINKGKEPCELTTFNANRKGKNINWNDDSQIPPNLKPAIKRSLNVEQYGRCAYCTREIGDDCQIEHYIPRATNLKLTWDYNNMLGVDNSVAMPQKYKNTCENGRGSKALHINPRDMGDMSGIYYSRDGRIKHDRYQDELDNVLSLNKDVYVNNRKNLLARLECTLKCMKKNGITINLNEIRKEYIDNNIVKPLCQIVLWFIDNRKLIY